jgi:hypothetical protein
MTLTSGTKLGPNEIQSPVGTGGIGEVYLASDTPWIVKWRLKFSLRIFHPRRN